MMSLFNAVISIGIGSIIALAVVMLCTSSVIYKTSSEERYSALSIGMISLLILPLLYVLIPTHHKIEITSFIAPENQVFVQSINIGNAADPTILRTEEKAITTIHSSIQPALQGNTSEYDVTDVTDVTDVATIKSYKFLTVLTYFSITILLIMIHGLRLSLLKQRISSLPISRNMQAVDLLNECKRKLNIKRNITLRVSKTDRTPWTWGLFSPVIVIPKEFSTWNEQEQRDAIVHELIHIKRYDQPIMLAAHVCALVYWFNPLAWMMKRKLIDEAEKSCDDRVIRFGANAPSYANQLLCLAKDIYADNSHQGYAVAMADVSSLSQRIRSILNTELSRRPITKFGLLAISLCTFILLTPISMMSISSDETDYEKHKENEDFVVINEKELGRTLLPILNPAPIYPPKALAENIEGYATVEYDVDSDGHVINERVIDAFPPEVFNEAALSGIRKFTYIPEEVEGKPAVIRQVKNRFSFNATQSKAPVRPIREFKAAQAAKPVSTTVPKEPIPPIREFKEAQAAKPVSPVTPKAPAQAIVPEVPPAPELPDLDELEKRAIETKNTQLHIQVAQAYADRGNWDNALFHILRASQLGDENMNSEFNMLAGVVLLNKGMHNEARKAFIKAKNNTSDVYLKEAAENWINNAKREQEKTDFIRTRLEDSDFISEIMGIKTKEDMDENC